MHPLGWAEVDKSIHGVVVRNCANADLRGSPLLEKTLLWNLKLNVGA